MMMTGKDRGKTGKVILVLPARNATQRVAGGSNEGKIVGEGLNLIKKHVRARKQGQKGQIISKERAVSVPSVSLVCKSCGKPTRVGYKVVSDNPDAKGSGLRLKRRSKIRICKKCKSEV